MKYTNLSNQLRILQYPTVSPFDRHYNKDKSVNNTKKTFSPRRNLKKQQMLQKQSSFGKNIQDSVNMSFEKQHFNTQLKDKNWKESNLQQFKFKLKELRDLVFQNQHQLDNDAFNLQKQFTSEIQLADSQFQQIFQLLNVRYGKCLERIKQKYQNAKRSIITYSITVEQTLQSLDVFQRDINKNYFSIINQLSINTFHNTMSEYKNKIIKAWTKIENVPDLRLQIETEKQTMSKMISSIMINDYRKQPRSFINQNQENDMNFSNVNITPHQSAKTQKHYQK